MHCDWLHSATGHTGTIGNNESVLVVGKTK
jgi:hypothetical protein